MAAVLAGGEAAWLSHRSGSALWQMGGGGLSPIDVTTNERRCRRRPGIAIHRPRRLHPDDVAEVDGIPVTSVARTLIDLADVIDRRRLARAIDAADRLGILFDVKVREAVERAWGRRGRRIVASLLAIPLPDDDPDTRSPLEDQFAHFCEERGLQVPVFNCVVEGYTVDAHWPGTKLVVELDSWEFHRGRLSFEDDRAKSMALQLARYRIFQVTSRRLRDEPDEVEEAIRLALER